MRILILTNLYPNPYQPERAAFNRQQFRALADRHSVRIIAPISWTDEMSLRKSMGSLLPPERQVITDGIPVSHPRYFFPPRILRSRYGQFFRASVSAEFVRATAEFQPDAVLASWAYPDGWAAVKLARAAKVPAVIKVHGSDVLGLEQHPDRRAGTVEALREASAVVAVSRDLADRVEALGVDSSRVRVVYNGVDTKLFHPGDRGEARGRIGVDGRPLVLFVGNLVEVKGIPTLLEACRILAEQGVEFQCRLVGKGPMEEEIRRRISGGSLGDRIALAGGVAHERLPDWFRAAAVTALPSQWEGVPNVLLESAACGTPFVASRVGGIPEIAHLGESALVSPGDAAALAAAIKEFLQGPASRRNRSSMRGHSDAAEEIADLLRGVARRRAVQPPAASPAG